MGREGSAPTDLHNWQIRRFKCGASTVNSITLREICMRTYLKSTLNHIM